MSAHWTHSLSEGRVLLPSPWKPFLPSTYFAPYSLPCGMSFVVSSEKLHFSRTEVMSFWETPSRPSKNFLNGNPITKSTLSFGKIINMNSLEVLPSSEYPFRGY